MTCPSWERDRFSPTPIVAAIVGFLAGLLLAGAATARQREACRAELAYQVGVTERLADAIAERDALISRSVRGLDDAAPLCAALAEVRPRAKGQR